MKSNFVHAAFLMLSLAVPLQHAFADEPATAPAPSPATVENIPLLHLPIDCVFGENCWVQNYFDADASAGATDFMCASRTNDKHKGTDIAVRDVATMEKGVAVLAALEGRILRRRDGEPDRIPTSEQMAAMQKSSTECGNGVVIDHGNGLTTQYCHLKQGSIQVQPEQQVKAGEKIGEVGLSGFTQFPHVHFQVAQDGVYLDPFTAMSAAEGCGRSKRVLWHPSANIRYQRTVLYAGGFHNAMLLQQDVEQGVEAATALSATDPLMAFWMSVMGPQKGDIIRATITGPDGKVVARSDLLMSKDRARQSHFIGHSLQDPDLQPGTYAGKGEVIRAGQVVQTLQQTVTVARPRAR